MPTVVPTEAVATFLARAAGMSDLSLKTRIDDSITNNLIALKRISPVSGKSVTFSRPDH